MATVKYGLTREGFKRKRLPEILDSLNKRVADKLGIEIQTSSNSVFGQLHGVYAYELADLWEQAENVYNAMYPSTATGVSLSNAAELAGITLIDAEKSFITATCYGDDGTAIPYGAQISAGDAQSTLWTCTDSAAFINAGKACYASMEIPIEVKEGTVYTLTIDGVQKAYTAKQEDTKPIVLAGLSSQFNFADKKFSLINDAMTLSMSDQENTFSIAVTGLSIVQIGSPVTFQCQTAGAINPALGTVTQIVTSYPGWKSVSNNVTTNVGRDAESDISLRQRWSSSLYDRASAMTDAIAASIYSKVPGVTVCSVYENNQDIKDGEGRPPHCIEAVVEGGQSNSIAQEIWNHKAGGIDTFGSENGTATDSQGIQHTMHFNRPERIPIWLKVVVGVNPDEVFPPAALSEIADAILAKGKKQTIGQDVILQRYFSTVFSATSGIGYIHITACTGDTAGTYTADNIPINDRQIAVFDAVRIEVSKQDE